MSSIVLRDQSSSKIFTLSQSSFEAPTFDGLIIGYAAASYRLQTAICSDDIYHKTNTPSVITSANNFQIGCCTAGSSCSDGNALPTACIPWVSMDFARFSGGYACTWDAAIPYCNRYTFSDPDYEFYSCGASLSSVNTNFLWPYQWSALYGERLASTTSFRTLPTSMPDPTTTSSKFAQPTGSPSVVSGTMNSNVRQRSEHSSTAVVAGAALAAVIGTIILCASLVLLQRRKVRRHRPSGCAEVPQSKPDEPNLEREKALVHELPATEISQTELDGTTVTGSPLQGKIE